jgi:hypothetical protein
VAQPHERQPFTAGQFAGQFAVGVGELAAVADMDGGQPGPVCGGVRAQPLGGRGPG